MDTATCAPATGRLASPRRKGRRQDGLATRTHLLQAAGEVFAERGYADATSKEICAKAGANVAAVNYYFGSKERLYEEVMIEGHRQIISLDDLQAITGSDGPAEDRLRNLLAHFVRTATGASGLWGVAVFLRELVTPSPQLPAVITQAVRPKMLLARGLIAEILGLPPEHPLAQRGLAFSVLPCLSLILLPAELRTRLLPATAADAHGMPDDLFRFILAGLRALSGNVPQKSPPASYRRGI